MCSMVVYVLSWVPKQASITSQYLMYNIALARGIGAFHIVNIIGVRSLWICCWERCHGESQRTTILKDRFVHMGL